MKLKPNEIAELSNLLKPILNDSNTQQMSRFMQHGNTTCLEHCVAVACWSYYIAKRLHVYCCFESLIKGAVLHDYFLYNWHIYKKSKPRGIHGFTHPKVALSNAKQSFELNKIECDIIEKHMWPVTIRIPKFKEAWIVVIADKICAFLESFAITRGTAYNIEKHTVSVDLAK